MQVFSNISLLLNLIELSAVNQKFIQTLTGIVVATSLERQVNTILYTSYENVSTFKSTDELQPAHLIRALAIGLPQPLLHFDYSSSVEAYKKTFNAELLTIARLRQRSDLNEQLLTTLWRRLWHNTQSRLILLLPDSTKESYISSILRMCARNRAMNVIALQPHMAVVEKKYWALHIFPTTKVSKSTFDEYFENIFTKHLENMYGHPLRLISSEPIYPAYYNHTTKDNASKLSGYYGKALSEYAYRLNATIEYSYLSRVIPLEMFNFIESNNIDIGLFVSVDVINYHSVEPFSYIDSCLMVRLEAPLPNATFYYKIMHGSFVLLFCISVVLTSLVWRFASRSLSQQQQSQQHIFEYFFSFSVLQGLLGSSFWTNRQISVLHKNICVFIWFTGILIGTAYNAFLQSYSVNAPIGTPTKTIDDILSRGIKVAVYFLEINAFKSKPEYRKYIQSLTGFTNLTEFQLLRDSFDTRYSFSVHDMWHIYDEQQKYFSRPLFRLTDMCLFKNYPVFLTLPENSVHQERLNDFQSRLQEAGLIEYWRRHSSFLELLEMDVIHLEDLNKKPDFEAMKLEDLRIILTAMSVFIGLSIFCFALELVWKKTFRFFGEYLRKNR